MNLNTPSERGPTVAASQRDGLCYDNSETLAAGSAATTNGSNSWKCQNRLSCFFVNGPALSKCHAWWPLSQLNMWNIPYHILGRLYPACWLFFFFLICHWPFNTFPVNTPLPLLIHASHPSQSWHNTNTLSCDLSHPVCHTIHSSLSLSFTRSLRFSLPVSLSFPSVFRTLLQLVCPYKAVVNQWGLITRT